MSDDLIVDLTTYRDRTGGRVLPGRYRVQVEDAERTTARSGNTMVNLFFRVQGSEFDGATIIDRLVITENSLFRVVGFLQALGIPTPRKRLVLNPRQFVGRVLEVDVEDGEPYNGRVKSEVRGYHRVLPAAGEDAPADLDLPAATDPTVLRAVQAAAPAAPAADLAMGQEIEQDSLTL